MAILRNINPLPKLLSNRFIRNLSWLGVSEIIIRVSRLLTTVILARFLSPHQYGLAAIILTIHDLVNVLTSVGINDKVIQVDQEHLNDICNSAYWLNWLVSIGISVLQCLLAFPISWFYQDHRLILPICISAMVYWMVPLANIQFVLIVRENRLKAVAMINSIQLPLANFLSAFLAFMGMGLWSLIIPRILITPLWIYMVHRNQSWRPNQGFTSQYWSEILRFGKHILGVSLLKTLRNNLDYLLVGRLIGIKELGAYYFAFNAGLGISLSVMNALSAALLPHLCALREDWAKFKQSYFSSLKIIAYVMIPLVILQSSLSPFYVPVIFGHQWIEAIPVLILICLSAIPRPFADAASNLLVSIDKPQLVLRWDLLFTCVFVGSLLIGVRWQAIGVATAVLIVHAIALPLFTLWATRYVFDKSRIISMEPDMSLK
ncbi:MAG: lipopolysaccharide biosynthesis protein [Leptolyngbyaceae bacterium]|nr:lipopolysaccharide biosynthesis protein [Leptolyngbyaceae bacterium]